MKFGFVLPKGDARTAADCAYKAEQAGWDGFFVWEPVWGIDAWVCLTAAAMRTKRIRLGTLLSPISRMRPWKLASETATLDHLSNGRVILSVGLGAVDTGFEAFGEVTNRKTRAELLDEGLQILTGLWSGQPFEFSGKHYKISQTTFQPPPPPVQQPRIPIWVVGAWPSEKSMRRALHYDGLLPNILEDGEVRMTPPSPDEVREIKSYIDQNRSEPTPFDIIVEGDTSANTREEATAIIEAYQEVGATWWIESLWSLETPEEILEHIRLGPPPTR